MSPEPLDPAAAELALNAVLARVESTLADVGEEFPLYADPETGTWTTTPDGNWCGGHWVALLWLAAARTSGREQADGKRYADAARSYAERLPWTALEGSMFGGLAGRYAGFRAYDASEDPVCRERGVASADAICDLYDEMARQVPVGTFETTGLADDSEASVEKPYPGRRVSAVDNVYTACCVLWDAFEVTGESHYCKVAVAHADRHLDWFVRPDGSTWHKVAFDPETGEALEKYNRLAAGDDTCWARGLGWSVAGLVQAYNHTEAERYLSTIERHVGYYVDRSPTDGVPYWDFEAPGIPNEPRDTSAAALVSYGLIRLGGDGKRERQLRAVGGRILRSLVENYLVDDPDDDRYGMVREGCYNKPGGLATEHELLWTNYYVASALETVARDASTADGQPVE